MLRAGSLPTSRRSIRRLCCPAMDRQMTYVPRTVVALLSLALVLVPPLAWAAEPVDMLLVLAADVSRSVTEPKFRLQRDGAAAAITHPDVVKAITSGPNRRIAVCFVEWATAGQQSVIVDWTAIGSAAAARSFGDRLIEAPRSFAGQHLDQRRHRLLGGPARARAVHLRAARHRCFRRRQQQFGPRGHRRPRRRAREGHHHQRPGDPDTALRSRSARSTPIRRAASKSTSGTTSSAVPARSPSWPKAMRRSAGP